MSLNPRPLFLFSFCLFMVSSLAFGGVWDVLGGGCQLAIKVASINTMGPPTFLLGVPMPGVKWRWDGWGDPANILHSREGLGDSNRGFIEAYVVPNSLTVKLSSGQTPFLTRREVDQLTRAIPGLKATFKGGFIGSDVDTEILFQLKAAALPPGSLFRREARRLMRALTQKPGRSVILAEGTDWRSEAGSGLASKYSATNEWIRYRLENGVDQPSFDDSRPSVLTIEFRPYEVNSGQLKTFVARFHEAHAEEFAGEYGASALAKDLKNRFWERAFSIGTSTDGGRIEVASSSEIGRRLLPDLVDAIEKDFSKE